MVCHFLPKFHPELNPIEYYWGWAKHYFRKRSNGNFAWAKLVVAKALTTCPLVVLRCFFRRADQYLLVYKLRATSVLAEFAMHRYASHCGVMQKELNAEEEEWRARKARQEVHACPQVYSGPAR
jgi:hypothetical protein